MQELTEKELSNLLVAIHLPKPCDVYTWQVTYRDGTVTCEYDESRLDGRGWTERDAKDVATITLARAEDGTEVQSMLVPEGAEPVFFRRRTVTVNPNDESIQRDSTVHCIGWKRADEAVYLFVYEDGSTLLTDNLQAV